MASLSTGVPGIYSSNDTHSSTGLDPSSWESFTISQILLPVVCALFISLVVVVIACCLIQRKPKSAGKWRKKSCHTIETSHETSDVGVYDVIDEMNVSVCTPEKTVRQCTKLDSNYMLGSHLLRHSKLDDVLPAAMTPVGSPFQAASNFPPRPLKLPPHPRRILPHPGQVSAYVQKCLDCTEQGNQDEGIYETLDRHTLFRNEGNDHTQLPSIDRSLSFYHRDTNNISRNSLRSSNTYETLNRKSEFEKPCSLCNYQKYNHIKDVLQDLHTTLPSSQTEESNKIVCQLSMFKVSGTQEKTTLIDKAYYQVQSQATACICASCEDISTMFHNRNLRLAHHRFRERSPDCDNDHDLILKPVIDAGGYVNNLRDSNTFANNLQKILMSHQSPLTVDSQKHHEFPVKRYENLKTANSDLCLSATSEHCVHRNGGCNILTALECSEIHTKYSDLTTSSEATRISAKLGPLPPLPVHYNVLNETCKNHSSLYKSNDTTFGCSQTKCTTSRITSPVRNILINQHSISTPLCRQFEITTDKRPKVNILNEEVDLIPCQVRSTNKCCLDSRKSDVDTPCVASTSSIGDSTKVDRFHENTNIYFILEPTSDVASLNSDTEDAVECPPRRNYNFR